MNNNKLTAAEIQNKIIDHIASFCEEGSAGCVPPNKHMDGYKPMMEGLNYLLTEYASLSQLGVTEEQVSDSVFKIVSENLKGNIDGNIHGFPVFQKKMTDYILSLTPYKQSVDPDGWVVLGKFINNEMEASQYGDKAIPVYFSPSKQEAPEQEVNKELLKACNWAKEQFKRLADEGKYPEFMLAKNGGNGIMILSDAILNAESNLPLLSKEQPVKDGFECKLTDLVSYQEENLRYAGLTGDEITAFCARLELLKDIISEYRSFQPKETDAVRFAEFISNGFWIQSSNDLWYQKSDGNIESGITTADLYQLFLKEAGKQEGETNG